MNTQEQDREVPLRQPPSESTLAAIAFAQSVIKSEQDREVPLREPLDPIKLLVDTEESLTHAAYATILSGGHGQKLSEVTNAAIAFAQAIIKAAPEGKETVVALNNIQAALMWARLGILLQPAIESRTSRNQPPES